MTRGVSSFLASTNSPLRLLVCCFLLLLSHSVAGLAQPLAHAPARVRAFTRDAHLMGSHLTFTAVSADDMLHFAGLNAAHGFQPERNRIMSLFGLPGGKVI